MLLDEGKREEAKTWFIQSARSDPWTQTRVGLLLYYEYDDKETGRSFLESASEQGYAPAKEAIKAIDNNCNAQILMGICDLLYYAGNVIDEKCDDMYNNDNQINYHGIDKKQRREISEKKQALGMKGI